MRTSFINNHYWNPLKSFFKTLGNSLKTFICMNNNQSCRNHSIQIYLGILRSNKSWGIQLRAAQWESMKTQYRIKSYIIIANKINRCWEYYWGLHGGNYSMNEPSPYLRIIWTWSLKSNGEIGEEPWLELEATLRAFGELGFWFWNYEGLRV